MSSAPERTSRTNRSKLPPLAEPAVTVVVHELLASEYLAPAKRAKGIAAGSASIFSGILLALVLGSILSRPSQIGLLVLIGAAYASAAALMLLVTLRHRGSQGDVRLAAGRDRLRMIWSDPVIRALTGLVLAGFGVFVAMSTWLQALLKPAGVSASDAGALLVEMVLAGVAGSALIPPLVARRHAEARLLRAVVLVTAAGCIALAVRPGLIEGALVMFFVGALLLTALPVVLEVAERRAGDAGATATAVLWLAGNAGGLVVALVVQVLIKQPAAAFAVMAAAIMLALPLARQGRLGQVAPAPVPAPDSEQRAGSRAQRGPRPRRRPDLAMAKHVPVVHVRRGDTEQVAI
jgi:predicted MFS family arabinose efflux permease